MLAALGPLCGALVAPSALRAGLSNAVACRKSSETVHDVIVIGGGVMGAATAAAAAKAGAKTLLVEQYGRCHPYGSSAGDGRIARIAYDCPLYVGLAHAAHRMWDELSARAPELAAGAPHRVDTPSGSGTPGEPVLAAWVPRLGQPVRRVCGSLDFGPSDSESLASLMATYDALGEVYELLSPDDVAARFPQFKLRPGDCAVYQAAGSVVYASLAVATLYAAAEADGAAVCEHTRVGKIELGEQGAVHQVVADDGRAWRARKIVVTGGGWTNTVLKASGLRKLPLAMSNEQTTYFAPRPGSGIDHSAAAMPTFIGHYFDDTPRGFYGIPAVRGGVSGVKVAVMNEGEALSERPDPATRDFGINRRMLGLAREFADELFPGLNASVVTAIRCIYSNSPDFDFILGEHVEHSDVVVGAGFSGHGFKFGPAIGQVLADYALGTDEVLDREVHSGKFSAARFSPT
ncbi:uncharacterized protein AMSG_03839 [Thecamonas trahens ATCC 50062]|uniref:FAD dependent oxidoreductase domain-containing protein n=1 Tax=Thecamonas trahens ATCC 50062 TaxID=461836 RepID=A0A0L0D5C2_THETB|nr:hypothetical protein AMSG_03839 [Thecamonas trahens ATCC 50062]KNC47405.1 hypothetical protein AMSG_03839 [Thecamonas trahens ATCC 50062]|eukprot:XP_013759743.1 hypothetical protein AMSG_03839 [Thecamonas trahens ATCC 50062]